MSDATERASAIARVKLYCSTSSEPVVSDSDVGVIVDECARAATWVQDTAYVVGQVVRPTVGNDHLYVCVQAGRSAALLADQPDWPTSRAATIIDGASDPILTWQEQGLEPSSIYNVSLAVHKCWVVKAARAAELTKLSDGNMQQVYDHCVEMMMKTAPFEIN